MSYSESQGELLFFSPNRTALEAFSSDFKEKLEKNGGEFAGPRPLPPADGSEIRRFLIRVKRTEIEGNVDTDEFSRWLVNLVDDDDHLELLVAWARRSTTLYARSYSIIGEHAIKSAFNFDLPEQVYADATLGQKTHPAGSGQDPTTWIPNLDHIPSHPDGTW